MPTQSDFYQGGFDVNVRSDLMGTWPYETSFAIGDDFVFSEQPNPNTPMAIQGPITTRTDINAFNSASDTATTFTVEKGTALTFIYSDMKKWLVFSLADGRVGYLQLMDELTLHDGTLIFDAFSGMHYYS